MLSTLLLLFSYLSSLRNKERSFYKNLRKLLEDLIASSNESHPIHCYSAHELIRATNNFHPSSFVKRDSIYKMFRGRLLDGRQIIITKYRSVSWLHSHEVRSLAIRDIVVSIQMSNHENVLKLLGCCLEFRMPALVHEYAAKVLRGDGSLTGDNGDKLPWNSRLRIAKQLANAVTHLQTAFPRPIIHRGLKPNCIFLDSDYVPKLSNFSLCITIPPMQSHVEVHDRVLGCRGYFDPAIKRSKCITERTDVYCFGIMLLVFLTGQRARMVTAPQGEYRSIVEYVRSESFHTIVDPKILEEVGENEQVQQQLQDFIRLALLCTEEERERRPNMMHVANELVRIDESFLRS